MLLTWFLSTLYQVLHAAKEEAERKRQVATTRQKEMEFEVATARKELEVGRWVSWGNDVGNLVSISSVVLVNCLLMRFVSPRPQFEFSCVLTCSFNMNYPCCHMFSLIRWRICHSRDRRQRQKTKLRGRKKSSR
jgi:hypothetical protein